MAFMVLALAFIFEAGFAPSVFAELPKGHDKFWAKNKNYQAMYDLYDLSLMNAYNQFDEKEYAALEKEDRAAIAANVKKGLASGKSEADAYAAAYGAQILHIDRKVTQKLTGDNPLEGFYQLESDELDGYFAISFYKDEKYYDMSFVVWKKAEPGKTGRCHAKSTQLKEKFTSSGVLNPKNAAYNTDPKIQIEISIENTTATITTTEAFKKGSYVNAGVGENFVKSALVIDGKYVLKKSD